MVEYFLTRADAVNAVKYPQFTTSYEADWLSQAKPPCVIAGGCILKRGTFLTTERYRCPLFTQRNLEECERFVLWDDPGPAGSLIVPVQVRLALCRFSWSGLVLVLFWLSEALAVERLPRHLHHGLDLRIHV